MEEEYLEEKLCGIIDLIRELSKKVDLTKIECTIGKIQEKLENFEKNAAKFDVMVKELNGSVTRCRALFEDRKNNAPLWYEIVKVQPPETGPIWIKDIDGNETMARCQGRSILYQSSDYLKEPVFWKPV